MKYIINNITYDSKYDILYVNFRTSSNSYGEEDIDTALGMDDGAEIPKWTQELQDQADAEASGSDYNY